MPCRVSSGVHERINLVPAVPARCLVNLQTSEQSGLVQRKEKTPWSFTVACCWIMVLVAENR